jgi:hypothetical protein
MLGEEEELRPADWEPDDESYAAALRAACQQIKVNAESATYFCTHHLPAVLLRAPAQDSGAVVGSQAVSEPASAMVASEQQQMQQQMMEPSAVLSDTHSSLDCGLDLSAISFAGSTASRNDSPARDSSVFFTPDLASPVSMDPPGAAAAAHSSVVQRLDFGEASASGQESGLMAEASAVGLESELMAVCLVHSRAALGSHPGRCRLMFLAILAIAPSVVLQACRKDPRIAPATVAAALLHPYPGLDSAACQRLWDLTENK